MLQIYHGDGKGKTTAAIGLAVRAAGAGKKVIFAQFMKGNVSSEIGVLADIPGIEVLIVGKQFGFYRNMSEDQKEQIEDCHNRILDQIWSLLQDETGGVGLIVMDEFQSAWKYELMETEKVQRILDWMKKDSENREVVMTGRGPDPLWYNQADYITEMKLEKHPYNEGILARKGIEY